MSNDTLHFDRVVVPLDGSDLAAAALPTARAAATRFGAALAPVAVAQDEDDVGRLVDAVAATVDADVAARLEVVVAAEPAKAIAAHADAHADPGGRALVVMSTNGRGRVAGAVLGSVARDVLASATSPLVVVGPNADRPGQLVGRPRRRPERWPEPLAEGDVVALVDGTASSGAVLPVAAQWAAALDRELVVLTVAEDAPPRLDGTSGNRFGPDDAAGYVEALAARAPTDGPVVRAELVHDPLSVAEGVKAYLRAHPTALLALTASGRTGLDRLRLGATAAEIVRRSTAPALVVPPPAR
jgi:nucleotide-binding universal stress UspA family protein